MRILLRPLVARVLSSCVALADDLRPHGRCEYGDDARTTASSGARAGLEAAGARPRAARGAHAAAAPCFFPCHECRTPAPRGARSRPAPRATAFLAMASHATASRFGGRHTREFPASPPPLQPRVGGSGLHKGESGARRAHGRPPRAAPTARRSHRTPLPPHAARTAQPLAPRSRSHRAAAAATSPPAGLTLRVLPSMRRLTECAVSTGSQGTTTGGQGWGHHAQLAPMER